MTRGLSASEAAARLAVHGPNALPERVPDPAWRRFLRQLSSPLIYILVCALAFDLTLWGYEGFDGWPLEAIAIGLILFFNAALGMYQEQRSETALARLRSLAAARAWVFRDGHLAQIAAELIVPGDVLRIEAGDRVPADGRLLEARGILLDESMLTGESVPVDKGEGDETSSGTLLVRGKGLVEVTRTGRDSAMGRLATMLGAVTAVKTPLERRVDRLGRQIARWVLAVAAALAILGVIAEGLERAGAIVIFAIALAVAAVPEGLPAVLTVALALGVERMARHRAVVRRLSAVEALGSVTVIATDKTGTLTESRMDVRAIDAIDPPRALEAIVLANDADLATGAGDPIELGLLRHAAAHAIDIAALRRDRPRLSERAFDSAWKFSRVTVQDGPGVVSYVKGAPEVVIGRAVLPKPERESWKEKAAAYASEGFRVLGIAWGQGVAEEGLTMLGLVLFWDPPRPEVPESVRLALAAGIRVVMITGDHPATALAVAQQIGIPGVRVLTGEDLDDYSNQALLEALAEVNVFARIRPAQKLAIVRGLQSQSHIVAMTGDGVNDAPALKQSDVGVAMGQRGSDVSREVADIVIVDDNFATIVRAVEEGRGIYENIQKFLRFLFSTNLSEVLLVASGALLAFAIDLRDAAGALMVPLTAAQILWINLITDGVPALALAFDRTPGVMNRPPRPVNSPLLDRPSTQFVVGAGVMKALLALCVLGLVPRLGYDLEVARAAAFHFMAIGQLLLTYPSRHTRILPLPNPYLHGAVAAGIAIQIGTSVLPWTATLLGGAMVPWPLWLMIAAGALLTLGLAETLARWVWRPATDRREP
jgi:Ca2+-transporting ATPase